VVTLCSPHDTGNDVERRHIIRMCGRAKAGNQDGANDTPGAPRCEHRAIDCACILWPEEVSSESWHRAKAATITQSNNSSGNEQQGKVANGWQDSKDDGLNDEHAQEGKGATNTVGEPTPEEASQRIENANDADDNGGS